MAGMKKAVDFVNRLYSSKHLILVNTVSCGVLMGFGDISMQTMERLNSGSKDPHNWRRTGRMVCMGVALGPLNHAWYTTLDRFLPAITTSTVLKKILLDQVIASPMFACSFFMGMGTLEGNTATQSWREFTSKFWDVYKADWSFWPIVQAINFRFVSPKFRVVYVASATYVWNTFLSYMKHMEEPEVLSVLTEEASSKLPIQDTISSAVATAAKPTLNS